MLILKEFQKTKSADHPTVAIARLSIIEFGGKILPAA
jgi:hypothetical protein